MALFKPYWMKEPRTDRGCEALNMKLDSESEESLCMIFRETESDYVRCEAIKRIQVQDVLKEAVCDPALSSYGKRAALDRIEDQEFIKTLIHKASADDSTDGESDNAADAAAADGSVTDEIRRYALFKVKDPVFLAEIAFSDNDPDIRNTARKEADDIFIHDHEWERETNTYLELLRNAEGDFELPEWPFIDSVTDRDDLVRVIQHDMNMENRRFAFMKAKKLGMADDPVLISMAADLAVNGSSYERWGAVEFTEDQQALAHAALHDPEWPIRETAVDKLTDQKVLAEVALNDSDEKIREAAKSRVDKASALRRAKKNHEHDFEYFTLYEKNGSGRMERLAGFKTCRKCGETFCCEKLYRDEPFCNFTWERRHIDTFTDAERVCFSCDETGDSYYGYILR